MCLYVEYMGVFKCMGYDSDLLLQLKVEWNWNHSSVEWFLDVCGDVGDGVVHDDEHLLKFYCQTESETHSHMYIYIYMNMYIPWCWTGGYFCWVN